MPSAYTGLPSTKRCILRRWMFQLACLCTWAEEIYSRTVFPISAAAKAVFCMLADIFGNVQRDGHRHSKARYRQKFLLQCFPAKGKCSRIVPVPVSPLRLLAFSSNAYVFKRSFGRAGAGACVAFACAGIGKAKMLFTQSFVFRICISGRIQSEA